MPLGGNHEGPTQGQETSAPVETGNIQPADQGKYAEPERVPFYKRKGYRIAGVIAGLAVLAGTATAVGAAVEGSGPDTTVTGITGLEGALPNFQQLCEDFRAQTPEAHYQQDAFLPAGKMDNNQDASSYIVNLFKRGPLGSSNASNASLAAVEAAITYPAKQASTYIPDSYSYSGQFEATLGGYSRNTNSNGSLVSETSKNTQVSDCETTFTVMASTADLVSNWSGNGKPVTELKADKDSKTGAAESMEEVSNITDLDINGIEFTYPALNNNGIRGFNEVVIDEKTGIMYVERVAQQNASSKNTSTGAAKSTTNSTVSGSSSNSANRGTRSNSGSATGSNVGATNTANTTGGGGSSSSNSGSNEGSQHGTSETGSGTGGSSTGTGSGGGGGGGGTTTTTQETSPTTTAPPETTTIPPTTTTTVPPTTTTTTISKGGDPGIG